MSGLYMAHAINNAILTHISIVATELSKEAGASWKLMTSVT